MLGEGRSLDCYCSDIVEVTLAIPTERVQVAFNAVPTSLLGPHRTHPKYAEAFAGNFPEY